MPGYRPYTLGSGDFEAPAAPAISGHYYRRLRWWAMVAGFLLILVG